MARKFPLVLELLADGSITLTTVCLLAGHLTADNHRALLGNAVHKSKRDVEEQVAALRPLPPVPSAVRKLPSRKPAPAVQSTPASMPGVSEQTLPLPAPAADSCVPVLSHRPAVVAPLAPDRYKVQFTVTRETHDKLRRVQDLLRHAVPDGDPAIIFDRALTLLLTELERKKLARTDRPRPATEGRAGSRHVPAHVRREVCPPPPRPAASRGYGETSPVRCRRADHDG